ncbi:LD-carboxypeptidase LdcB [Lentibacillus halophilus]|uniref:LD-carboxypeptidase LdcB n=1 Tax=Lentibacillus halophilus TaxID=295065 RepID=A0ABN0Z3Q4_9BACI
MFYKSLTAIFILFNLTFLTTACNGSPDNNGSADHTPTDKTDNQKKDRPKDTSIDLPQEQLQKTDQGQAVKTLQKALNNAGYSISDNGTFDRETTWALTDFQLQQDSLTATGIYNEPTRNALQKKLDETDAVKAGAVLRKPDEKPTAVGNPHDILALVNKDNRLPGDFVPRNLTVPDVRFPFDDFLPKKQMRKVAAQALEDMFQAANNNDLELFAQSGYRSYERQDAIFASNVRERGEEAANKVSAKPGESEHQTGLTMDVTSPDVNYRLVTDFGQTDEGQWIKQHASEYGFIIRYPKGKQAITKYQYEPWHLRYVGQKAATAIMKQDITLEEYLGEA